MKRNASPPITHLLALPLLVLGLAAAGCGGGHSEAKAPVEEAAEKVALVRTETPVLQDVDDVVSLSADLEPTRRAVLASEVSGVVERLSVELGQRVGAGQTVAAIDTRTLEQALAEARALDRQARAQYERAEALFEKRSITKAQMLDAVTNRDVAEARLASAELDLDKSRVEAPWAGRVAGKRAEVGDYVTPGMPLVELVEVDALKVVALASAADVPFLELGRPVTIKVDALPGESFTGKIVRLGAVLDEVSRTLDVEAEIANPDGRLRPGMLARMEVPRQTLEDAILVPLEAVVDLGEERALFVAEDGVARRRIVELGPVIGDRVVILSGVAAGEPVIVQGGHRVADGQAVEEAS
jgi:membrane fusion protein (multidrug efflux system)